MSSEIRTDGIDPLLRDGFDRPYIPVEIAMRSGDNKKSDKTIKIIKLAPGFYPQGIKEETLATIDEL